MKTRSRDENPRLIVLFVGKPRLIAAASFLTGDDVIGRVHFRPRRLHY